MNLKELILALDWCVYADTRLALSAEEAIACKRADALTLDFRVEVGYGLHPFARASEIYAVYGGEVMNGMLLYCCFFLQCRT